MKMSNSNHSSPTATENKFNNDFQMANVKLDETFSLIQALIPLKTCQFYQILPIVLEENILVLAMVNPDDNVALDHINLLIAPYNYALKIEHIDQQTHQIIISSYLNYSRAILSEQKLLEEEQETKIEADQSVIQKSAHLSSKINKQAETTQNNFTTGDQNILEKNYDINNDTTELGITPTSSSLKVDAHYLSAPADFLATLAPTQIWRELLGRVLMGGIGRLYFEQKANYGRILWSQNGVLQFAVNEIATDVFHEVLNEIKKVAHLPLVTVHKITKVEIEKYYQGERLLFRLRLNPGEYGEEGNLQILRGKALIFYQQRQMNDMATQALNTAQELERKLRQMRARKKINPSPINNLQELNDLQESIQRQLKLLLDS
jgi:type II secretory ATPase GspE/PulE/Tfp pilus assembly ATPase PilB-like protein